MRGEAPRPWSLRVTALAAFAAVACASVIACSTAPKGDAGLELIVAADGLGAMDFDRIRLEISQQDGSGWDKLWDNEYLVPSNEAKLPAAFTLLAGQSAQEVLISVTALQGAQPVVQRLAQVQVPTDRLADLWLILAKVCVGTVTATGAEAEPQSTCKAGESCQPTGPSAGQCGSNIIVTTTLPTYSPGQDFDAGPLLSDATAVSMADAREEQTSSTGPSADAGHDATVVAADSGDETSTTDTDSGPNATATAADSGDATSTADAGREAGATQDAGDASVTPDSGPSCAATICQQVGAVCQDDKTLATCAKDGAGCLHVGSTSGCSTSTTCLAGGCGGVCGPTQTRCSGNTPQTCASGAWVSAAACGSSKPYCMAGACSVPPSCQAGGDGLTNCGASSESCCTSLDVTGGTFDRTYTNTGTGPTGEADPATVSGYRLDKYDVTVGRFRQFVTAWNGGSGWTPPAGSGKHTHLNGGQGLANSGSAGTFEPGWAVTDNGNIAPTASNLACSAYAGWTASAGSNERLAIGCPNWFEAYAFCIWDGGFLPSEAEWEYAAAGGSQQREYPWGSTAPGTANQYAIYGCNYPSGSGTCTGLVNVAPVGTATLGGGVWGQLDLAGTTWQWNMDWQTTFVNPCIDCGYFTTVSARVIRGGPFDGPISTLTPSYSGTDAPTNRFGDVGFRCARSP